VTRVATSAENLSSEQSSFGCQATTLVVGEAKMPTADLRAKDPVFLAQILDGVLLALIHPPGDRNQQKPERIRRLQHRFSSLSFLPKVNVRPASPPFPSVSVFGQYAVNSIDIRKRRRI